MEVGVRSEGFPGESPLIFSSRQCITALIPLPVFRQSWEFKGFLPIQRIVSTCSWGTDDVTFRV